MLANIIGNLIACQKNDVDVILISGLILAFPYVFYQFWNFIRPALTKKELQRTRGVIFWVSFLFFTGVLFGYFVVAPYALNFFFHFQLTAQGIPFYNGCFLSFGHNLWWFPA